MEDEGSELELCKSEDVSQVRLKVEVDSLRP